MLIWSILLMSCLELLSHLLLFSMDLTTQSLRQRAVGCLQQGLLHWQVALTVMGASGTSPDLTNQTWLMRTEQSQFSICSSKFCIMSLQKSVILSNTVNDRSNCSFDMLIIQIYRHNLQQTQSLLISLPWTCLAQMSQNITHVLTILSITLLHYKTGLPLAFSRELNNVSHYVVKKQQRWTEVHTESDWIHH